MILLAFLFILSTLVYISWERWLTSTPQPLPQKSTVAAASNHLAQGTYYEGSAPVAKSDWHISAEYRLWIPSEVKTLRGLLVMQHGCGRSGLDYANDLQWQALALKHKLAILGSKISAEDQPCEFWAFPKGGSETTFLKILHFLGSNSSHPEVETIPWVLWGHSGGAEWVSYMLQKYPQRTIAMVAMRGGGYPLIGADASTLHIPVLFAVGEDDPYHYDCVEIPKQVFLHQRQKGGLWAFASAPNAAHEAGDTRFFAIPYLDAVIPERLDSKDGKLAILKVEKGWLGNLFTNEISPIANYAGNHLKAAWFPNEAIAYKWQEYVTTGKISATRKPTAPADLSVTKIGTTEALLTWKYIPDLENGLPSFRIYRNSSLIQTLKGQEHDFGDAAEPPNVVLEFRDKSARINASYSVAAFNTLGENLSQSTYVNSQ